MDQWSTASRRKALRCVSLVSIGVLTTGLLTTVRAQSRGTAETHNKQLIQQAFDRWADGSGNFFDLLTHNVQWTITGSSPYAKTYTSKKQFVNEAVLPLSRRLAKPIVPCVRNLYADGDVVVAIWDGVTTAKDGKPYCNTYSWVMTLNEGRITHVTAFLDLQAYDAVIRRK